MCVCLCVYVLCVRVRDKLHVYMGVLHISQSCLYAKPKLETRRLLCDIASQIHADNYNTVRRTSGKIFMDTAGMLVSQSDHTVHICIIIVLIILLYMAVTGTSLIATLPKDGVSTL